jgi:signal transduction histidine kinase/CheY-like chemotaxis protein
MTRLGSDIRCGGRGDSPAAADTNVAELDARGAGVRDALLESVGVAARLLFEQPLPDALPDVQASLGQAVGASRVSVYEYRPTDAGLAAALVHEWLRPGIEADPWGQERLIEGSAWEPAYRALAAGDVFRGNLRDLAPEQQAPVRSSRALSLAAMPIVADGALWGDISFADCAAERVWSRAELDGLFIAAQVIGAAVARERADAALRRRDAILEAVSVVARMLLRTPLEDCAGEALRLLGEAVGASRSYIFHYVGRTDGKHSRQLAEWCAPGIAPDPWTEFRVEADEYLPWHETLVRGDVLHGPVSELPLSERLAVAGIRSLADVPIFVDGTLWGNIGFDDCVSARVWSPTEIDTLITAAQVIGAGLARQRAEASLGRRDAVFEAIAECARLLLEQPLESCAAQILARLGTAFGASRAYVCAYADRLEEGTSDRVIQWCADGVDPDPWDYSPVETWAHWYVTLGSGRPIHGSVTALPRSERRALATAQVVSLAVAPVFVDGRFWGEVGLDDCETERAWSTAEIDGLFTAAQVVGAALARERQESAVRTRDAILDAVSAAARLLLEHSLEDRAEHVLAMLGQAVAASRTHIFVHEEREGRRVSRLAYSWSAPGIDPDPGEEFVWEGAGFEACLAAFRRGEAICGPIRVFPAHERLEATGTKSAACVPIFAEGELWGDLAFDDCISVRAWSHAELDALEAAAGVIGATITRQRGAEALRRSEELLQQSQRLEAIGRLAGGVAHDFNNLLTVITGHVGLALGELSASESVLGSLEQIRVAAQQAVALTGQLLAFSRRQVVRPRAIDVNDIVVQTEAMLQRLIGEDIGLVHDLAPGPVVVNADPIQLQQVLVNLVVNARDAMPDGGTLVVRTERSHGKESDGSGGSARTGDFATLEITDTGLGMDPQTAARIFEPFFTTKEQGRGTGLGLATVYGIVKLSGGEIDVESAPGSGSCFRVHLPLIDDAHVVVPLQPTRTAASGSETVLVCEDEEPVRSLIATLLERSGYRVLTARSAREALSLAESHAGSIDLLLTDVVMPAMSGRQLAERLRSTRPALPVLFVSGYPQGEFVRRGAHDPHVPLLPKPFTSEALRSRVRETLDAARTSVT